MPLLSLRSAAGMRFPPSLLLRGVRWRSGPSNALLAREDGPIRSQARLLESLQALACHAPDHLDGGEQHEEEGDRAQDLLGDGESRPLLRRLLRLAPPHQC